MYCFMITFGKKKKAPGTRATTHDGYNLELGGVMGSRRGMRNREGLYVDFTSKWKSKEIDAKGREARRQSG